jgi:pimeloyl-ACP methyl ester carboxylesterase
MDHVDHRGIRIAYETVGEGPPLMLLQGLGLSSRFWFSAPGQLAKRFRVVLVDNRGTGSSDRPRGLWSIRAMARDALAVADALGLERFGVAGISLGGMIAQELALAVAPGRLNGLALLATTCGLPKGKIPPPGSLWTLLKVAGRKPKNLDAIHKLLVSAEALQSDPNLFRDFERLMAATRPQPSVFLRQLLAASTHSTGRRLGRIRCPTLVASGDGDRLIPPENSRVLARLIPGAKLVLLPGAGHAFPLERRDVLVSLLTDFFGGLELSCPAQS